MARHASPRPEQLSLFPVAAQEDPQPALPPVPAAVAPTVPAAPPTLRAVQPGYEDFLLALGRSRHTVTTQRADLGLLVSFLGDRPVTAIALADLRGFVAWLRATRGNDPRSLRRKVASVKGLFSFLHREGIIPDDPARQLVYPIAPPHLPEALEPHEAAAVVDAAAPHPTWLALVLILLDSGLKRDELLALDVADLVLQQHPPAEGALIVRATRDAQTLRARRLRLSPRLHDALVHHLGGRSAGVVFPLSVRAVNFIVAECGHRAGIQKRGPVTPQMLRDTFALTQMRTLVAAEATAAAQGGTAPELIALRDRHNRELLALLGLDEAGDGALRYRILASPLPGAGAPGVQS